MGPIGCPETSVRNWHSTLRKIREEHRSHIIVLFSANIISRVLCCIYLFYHLSLFGLSKFCTSHFDVSGVYSYYGSEILLTVFQQDVLIKFIIIYIIVSAGPGGRAV